MRRPEGLLRGKYLPACHIGWRCGGSPSGDKTCLDDIAAFVGAFVIAMWVLAGRIWRDDSLDPPLCEFLAQASGVVGSVGDDTLWSMPHSEQTAGSVEVVDVSSRDQQGIWTPDLIGQRVDFGRLPAARAADGIVEGPPFAPAAERWALM